MPNCTNRAAESMPSGSSTLPFPLPSHGSIQSSGLLFSTFTFFSHGFDWLIFQPMALHSDITPKLAPVCMVRSLPGTLLYSTVVLLSFIWDAARTGALLRATHLKAPTQYLPWSCQVISLCGLALFSCSIVFEIPRIYVLIVSLLVYTDS